MSSPNKFGYNLHTMARIIASEDINFTFTRASTASFDLKTRTLNVPPFMASIASEDVQVMLYCHEISHAMNTPIDGWHRALSIAKRRGKSGLFARYINIVEDARIEKLIQTQYPGAVRHFTKAYSFLFNDNFFQTKGITPEDLSLIDRINLHFKLGDLFPIGFTEKEMYFVNRIRKAKTFKEVVQISRELFIHQTTPKEKEQPRKSVAQHDRDKEREEENNEEQEMGGEGAEQEEESKASGKEKQEEDSDQPADGKGRGKEPKSLEDLEKIIDELPEKKDDVQTDSEVDEMLEEKQKNFGGKDSVSVIPRYTDDMIENFGIGHRSTKENRQKLRERLTAHTDFSMFMKETMVP